MGYIIYSLQKGVLCPKMWSILALFHKDLEMCVCVCVCVCVYLHIHKIEGRRRRAQQRMR